jgi:hypothetical protein
MDAEPLVEDVVRDTVSHSPTLAIPADDSAVVARALAANSLATIGSSSRTTESIRDAAAIDTGVGVGVIELM